MIMTTVILIVKVMIIKQELKNDYNHGNNILKLFDTLPNFLFTTSQAKRDY